MSDDLQSTLPQPVVLIVAQGLRRCNHNRLTCVDTHWIEILHVADSDAVVILVPAPLRTRVLSNPSCDGQSPTEKASTKLLSPEKHAFQAGKTHQNLECQLCKQEEKKNSSV